MGKDIRSFASDMKISLAKYKKELEEDLSYATRNEGEAELNKLHGTLSDLREYVTVCCGMILNIPDSKKVISALNAKITPLCNELITSKTGKDCLIQARNVILALNEIV